MEYFAALGIQKGDSKSKIKKAFYKLMQKYHPDKNKQKNAREIYNKILSAFAYLKANAPDLSQQPSKLNDKTSSSLQQQKSDQNYYTSSSWDYSSKNKQFSKSNNYQLPNDNQKLPKNKQIQKQEYAVSKHQSSSSKQINVPSNVNELSSGLNHQYSSSYKPKSSTYQQYSDAYERSFFNSDSYWYYVGLYDDNDNAGQNKDYLYTDPYSYEITNEYLPNLHDWGLPSDNNEPKSIFIIGSFINVFLFPFKVVIFVPKLIIKTLFYAVKISPTVIKYSSYFVVGLLAFKAITEGPTAAVELASSMKDFAFEGVKNISHKFWPFTGHYEDEFTFKNLFDKL